VVTGGAGGFLQHWGTIGSEAGRAIDDGELGRVEFIERGRSGGGGSEFVADGGAPMVGLGQEAKGDAGGVARGRFNTERERETAEKEHATRRCRLPFKPVEKEVGRGVPVGVCVWRREKGGPVQRGRAALCGSV
jgi:hypothetical protein